VRLTLISPPFGDGSPNAKGLPIAPPVLEYLAGLTHQVRPGTEVDLIDAHQHPFDVEGCAADLVGISVLTPQAPWAYKTADALRHRGIQVVLGGVHVSALPEEAAGHANSIVVGEAESVWGQVLQDAMRYRLADRYDGTRSPLEGLPRPATSLLPDVYPFGSFFTSRGCPHACSFCAVHKFFGRSVRLRPIDEVVREVAASERRLFFNLDDNAWGVDVPRSIDLFREMGRTLRHKYWFGQADLVSVGNPRSDELLTAAHSAGMRAVMVGYESENETVLADLHAVGKQGRDRVDAIKRIRSHGIDVVLFVMVGAGADFAAESEAILELCDRLDVSAHPQIVTPFPGTELYGQYESRLLGFDWDRFDGTHAVYTDPTTGVETRERGLLRLRSQVFETDRILRRVRRIPLAGFPTTHVFSFIMQYLQGRGFREWELGYDRVPETLPEVAEARVDARR